MKLIEPGSADYVILLWRRYREDHRRLEWSEKLYRLALKDLDFDERERLIDMQIKEIEPKLEKENGAFV